MMDRERIESVKSEVGHALNKVIGQGFDHAIEAGLLHAEKLCEDILRELDISGDMMIYDDEEED